MRPTRRDALILASGALAFPFAVPSAPALAAAEPITVGATVPTTGPLSLTGRQYLNSLALAEEEINRAGGINGRPLKIAVEDTGASNSTAVSAFVKLVQAYAPPFVFLSSYSTQNLATAPEVTKAGVPVMYSGGADAVSELGNPLMFRIRPVDSLAAKGMVKFLTGTLKAKKPGILAIQNDFGQGGARTAAKLLGDAGVAVAGSEAYGQNDKDFSAQLLRLRSGGADVVLAFCYPADGALILRQVKALGLKVPLLVSSSAFVPAALQLVSPGDLDGAWCVTDAFVDASAGGRMKDFVDRYRAKFGTDADPYAVAYYDGAAILAAGLRKVGPDPRALRDWLAAVKGWQGAGHSYSFDAHGNGVTDMAVVKAKPGTKSLELVESLRLS